MDAGLQVRMKEIAGDDQDLTTHLDRMNNGAGSSSSLAASIAWENSGAEPPPREAPPESVDNSEGRDHGVDVREPIPSYEEQLIDPTEDDVAFQAAVQKLGTYVDMATSWSIDLGSDDLNQGGQECGRVVHTPMP